MIAKRSRKNVTSIMGIIFLNGCTSAGKSSIARALQACLQEPHAHMGIDDALQMIPARLHNHPDGVCFEHAADGVHLMLGPFGLLALHVYRRTVASIAGQGANLILDEVVFGRDVLIDWLRALNGLDVLMVGVMCPLPELERRERLRGDRLIGQARAQFDIVHAHARYDMKLDTSSMASAMCASRIAEAMEAGTHTRAFERMRLAFGFGD